ncbi:MAG: hypothetical protein OXF93_03705 [Acidobacteria bacterium]|nr:hypothetical protein [Acidobacteriota bacterium]
MRPTTTPFRDLFGIDTRSLAVFRVALAAAVVADLLLRAPDLAALYTEEGVLPRALLDEQVRARAPALVPILALVPHLLLDGAAAQALLFAVAGAVAVLLAAGWRTRWVTVASWVLMMSLQARNPAVRNGGDEILRLLLFWAMFLPLGAIWSADARRAGRPAAPRLVTGGAPAALLLQVVLIYPFNALYKDGAAWTTDFTALELFLGNVTWGGAWGTALLAYPGLLQAMTAGVLGLERFGWLLAFCPVRHGPARTLAVLLFAGFHGGILVLSRIDLFAAVGIVAWTAFLPAWFWTQAAAAAGRREPGDAAPARQPVPRWEGAAALALIGYVGFLNVTGYAGLFGRPVPTVLQAPALVLQIDQQWNMFSPEPSRWSRFLVARGETAAGRSVDLLAGGEPRDGTAGMNPPAGPFGRDRWRAYFNYLRRQPDDARDRLGGGLAAYLGRQWNAAHHGDDRLERVRLFQVNRPIVLAGDPEPNGRRIRVRELLAVDVATP